MRSERPGFPVSEAVMAIHNERARQILRGFDANHDNQHVHGDLSMLGWEILYHLQNLSKLGCSAETREWIDKRASDIVQDHDVRTALVKAAACILADIERMDRMNIVDNRDAG